MDVENVRFTVTREAACDGRDVQTHPQSFKEQNRVSALRTEEMPDEVEADTLLSRGLPGSRGHHLGARAPLEDAEALRPFLAQLETMTLPHLRLSLLPSLWITC